MLRQERPPCRQPQPMRLVLARTPHERGRELVHGLHHLDQQRAPGLDMRQKLLQTPARAAARAAAACATRTHDAPGWPPPPSSLPPSHTTATRREGRQRAQHVDWRPNDDADVCLHSSRGVRVPANATRTWWCRGGRGQRQAERQVQALRVPLAQALDERQQHRALPACAALTHARIRTPSRVHPRPTNSTVPADAGRDVAAGWETTRQQHGAGDHAPEPAAAAPPPPSLPPPPPSRRESSRIWGIQGSQPRGLTCAQSLRAPAGEPKRRITSVQGRSGKRQASPKCHAGAFAGARACKV